MYENHVESIGSALSTIRRTAEATALRMMITDQTKDNDQPVVVLADFNDSAQSNTLDIITGQSRYLREPWSKGERDTGLYSVGVLQALRSLRDVHYTYNHEGFRETLDHILVSRELYDHSEKREWGFREMLTLNDHLDDTNHKDSGNSDHGVVMAKFEYRPARRTG